MAISGFGEAMMPGIEPRRVDARGGEQRLQHRPLFRIEVGGARGAGLVEHYLHLFERIDEPLRFLNEAETIESQISDAVRIGYNFERSVLTDSDAASFWRTYHEMQQDRLLSIAGGVSFFVLLAIFPAITALVSTYGLFLIPPPLPTISGS